MSPDCAPEDVKTLGHELMARSDMAAIRAAVGRFYYANFLHACHMLGPKLKVHLNGAADDHGKIVRALRERGGRGRSLADMLRMLREYRNHADYHVGSTRGEECLFCTGKMSFSDQTKKSISETADELFSRLSTF